MRGVDVGGNDVEVAEQDERLLERQPALDEARCSRSIQPSL